MQSGTIGYWIDQARAGQRYDRRGRRRAGAASRSSSCDLHRLEICIVPRNHNSRRVMEKLAIREEGIAQRFLEINGVVGGPRALRHHRRGVARPPRRARAGLALTSGRRLTS